MATYKITVSLDDLGFSTTEIASLRIRKHPESIADSLFNNYMYEIKGRFDENGIYEVNLLPDDFSTRHEITIFDNNGIAVYNQRFSMPFNDTALTDAPASAVINTVADLVDAAEGFSLSAGSSATSATTSAGTATQQAGFAEIHKENARDSAIAAEAAAMAIRFRRPLIAYLGDSLTAFGIDYPMALSGSEPDWLRLLGGIQYGQTTGTGTLEYDYEGQKLRWTAPGDTAGAWADILDGFNVLQSGTTGGSKAILIGIRRDFLPTADLSQNVTVSAGNLLYKSISYFAIAQILSGNLFAVSAIHGIGGDRTRHVLARINQVFTIDSYGNSLAVPPQYVSFMCGTNDIVADNLGATVITQNIQDIVDYIIANKARPIVHTITARNGMTAPQLAVLAEVNAYIRNMAAITAEIIFVDSFAITRNPSSSDGSAITNVLYDGTHTSNYGAFLIGKEFVRVVLPQATGVVGRATSLFAGDPKNKQPNNNFSGTGGVSSNPPASPPTQVVADGYTVSRSGGTTVTISATKESVLSELDWQVLTCADATLGDVVQFTRTTHPSPASVGLAVGDTIYVDVEFAVINPINIRRVDLTIMLFDGTQGKNVSANGSAGVASSDFPLPNENYSGVLRTPNMVIPSGVTQLRVFMRVVFNGGGSAIVKFRAPGLIKV